MISVFFICLFEVGDEQVTTQDVSVADESEMKGTKRKKKNEPDMPRKQGKSHNPSAKASKRKQ